MRFVLAVEFFLLLIFAPSLAAQGAAIPSPGRDPIEGTWTVTNTQNPPLGSGEVTITAIPGQDGKFTHTSCTGDAGIVIKRQGSNYLFESTEGGGSGVMQGGDAWAWQNNGTGQGGTMAKH